VNYVLADPSYVVVFGDAGPPLQATLMVSTNGITAGSPFVLNAGTDTVTFNYLGPDKVTRTVAAAIMNAAAGIVECAWTSGDLPALGTYEGQFVVQRSGDNTFPQSWPSYSGGLSWPVVAAVGSGFTPAPAPTGAAYVALQALGADPVPPGISNYFYFGTDGGLHAKMNGGAVTLAPSTHIYNVLAFGALGNGVADDSVAIRAAVAACAAAGGGQVYFPNGTYVISEAVPNSSGYCINAPANTAFVGESKFATILKLAADQAHSVRPFYVTVADVRIATMTIDGNKANQLDTDEHRAAIFLYTGSIRVLIEDCILQNCTGDGIDCDQTDTTVIQRCYIANNDRDGVTVEGLVNNLTIRDCFFDTNGGAIGMECQVPCSSIWIDNCHTTYPANTANTSVGIGPNIFDCVISNCRIYGGLSLSESTRTVVSDCYIETGEYAAAPCPLTIQNTTYDMLVSRTTFVQTAAQTGQGYVVFMGGSESEGSPTRTVFDKCHFLTASPSSHGIYGLNVTDLSVIDCRIETSANGNTSYGLVAYGTDNTLPAPQVNQVYVRGCHFYNWKAAIDTGVALNTMSFGNLMVVNSIFEGQLGYTCYAFNLNDGAQGGPTQCLIAANEMINLTGVFESLPSCPILTGGIRGAGGIYSCVGSPQSVIAEVAGALALRSDGGANTTLYLKTSGTGNTGWTAVSSS
jgi:Pectate lyase superfamily protein